ncbi:transketolase [Sphingomonas sp. PR090111-T3T-6A]|uniref:transketolase n=1 Tax=Sphingomonas sp. PR090111-T3T-6A TaxID=685778 RepID=UPI00036FAC53|nr:transketolase [Sphingomonas sp. PR090111-T3T-6A]
MNDTDTAFRPSTSVAEDGSPDRLAIDTIRTLSMDAVQKANSGHPGTPMALAPVGHELWTKFLRYDPAQPLWPNRDRFVLSVGHASMLLYSLLHLAQVKEFDRHGKPTGKLAVSLEDIEQFRQLDSKTPGHPEYRFTTGVETTTGPLGAGCGNSVGMAVAERWLAQHFNREGFPVFEHDVYTLCGDGDMMEGISSEAASTAGHLKLSNLCWIYDSNTISIEGHTDIAFTEDVALRFKAYGWATHIIEDANDTAALGRAIEAFKAEQDRPTFILVKSIIGWGSPKANSEKAHGEPLGADAIKATKEAYGWPQKDFYVPEGVTERFSGAMKARSQPLREEWEAMVARYRTAHPDLAAELDTMLAGKLPEGWADKLPVFDADPKGLASRDSGGKAENAIAATVPWLVGGSADLAPSTKTLIAGSEGFQPGAYGNRNMHFGVREHAMGAIVNGMALSYLRSFGATFLVFSDYMRPPIRLAAIMELPSIFVFTHDSIGVGEDGPTHQPIEHLASLRAIPGLDTIRPGDANEVTEAWKAAVASHETPTCLIFSRQALPTLDRSKFNPAEGLHKGAYVLTKDEGTPDIILISTGSELSLAVEAADELAKGGTKVRVVSMPSWYLFEKQDKAYRDNVLPPAVKARVAIEQGGEIGWDRYVGIDGATVTMSTFGASAPLKKLQDKFGFTVENVVKVAREVMGK